jgi:hypothetical protein
MASAGSFSIDTATWELNQIKYQINPTDIFLLTCVMILITRASTKTFMTSSMSYSAKMMHMTSWPMERDAGPIDTAAWGLATQILRIK